MECYPPCKPCSGFCDNLTPVPVADTTIVQKTVVKPAQSRSGYILLRCLHYTTPEDQRAVRPHKPRGRKFWCPDCSKWMQQIPLTEKLTKEQEEALW